MGGSSGSGGGSSGAVSYPAYMESKHSTWLDAVAAAITTAVTGDSPYTSAVAYDPDCVLNATNYIISQFNDAVVALAPETDWSSAYDIAYAKYAFGDYFSTAATATTVAAYQADLESRRDTDFKPSYKVGMLNINAAMSSSFVIGDALITSQVARDVAKFSADLTFKNEERQANYELQQAQVISGTVKNILDAIASQINFYQSVAHTTADANRIKIVSKNEESDKNILYDEKDALWDLEMYTYGGNMLAAIAGGTSASASNKPSTSASVLGGALSGAAAGSAIAPGIGTAIGGVLGGLGGLL